MCDNAALSMEAVLKHEVSDFMSAYDEEGKGAKREAKMQTLCKATFPVYMRAILAKLSQLTQGANIHSSGESVCE